MALNSFQLFLQQYQPSPPSLRLRILQIVFDVMMTYESDFLGNPSVGVRLKVTPLIEALTS